MRRERMLLIMLLAAALLLLVAWAWAGWEVWGGLRLPRAEYEQPPAFLRQRFLQQPDHLSTALGTFFTFALSGTLFLFLFPQQVRRMDQALPNSFSRLLRLALLGFVTGLFLGVISFSSTLSMSTFPISIFVGSLLFLAAFAGYIVLAYSLGHRLMAFAGWEECSPLYALLAGLLILSALGVIPFVGVLFKVLFASWGLGLITLTRFGSGQPWNLAPLKHE